MHARERLREAVGLAVDDEVDAPLPVEDHVLRTVARELRLPVTVEVKRVEQIDSRETFDLITSRALAALPALLSLARPFADPDGHLLLHKGRNHRQELDAAAQHFHFDVLVHPSESDPEGVILEITNLRAKSAA